MVGWEVVGKHRRSTVAPSTPATASTASCHADPATMSTTELMRAKAHAVVVVKSLRPMPTIACTTTPAAAASNPVSAPSSQLTPLPGSARPHTVRMSAEGKVNRNQE